MGAAGRAKGILVAVVAAALCLPASAAALNPIGFSSAGKMSMPRDYPAAADLGGGYVAVFGGYGNGDYLDSGQLFGLLENSFVGGGGIGHMPEKRWGASAAKLPSGDVLVAGGYDETQDLNTALLLGQNGMFVGVGIGTMTRRREGAPAAPMGNGKVVIAGGYDSDAGAAVSDAEIYDPASKTFSASGVGTMSVPRYRAAGAELADGRVLVVGGNTGSAEVLRSTEFFDPKTLQFTPGPDMMVAREAASAAPLPGGRVLVVGGQTPEEPKGTTSAEIYDPKTNSFSSAGVGPLAGARNDAAAVALEDGRVLVAGGEFDGSQLDSAEMLSVPSNAFSVKAKGTTIEVTVSSEGSLRVVDIKQGAGHKKKKCSKKKPFCAGRPALIKPLEVAGGPAAITARLRMTGRAKSALKVLHKAKTTVHLTFTPDGGLPKTQPLTIRLKKKHKRTH